MNHHNINIPPTLIAITTLLDILITAVARIWLAVWCWMQTSSTSSFTDYLWWVAVAWLVLSIPLPHPQDKESL